MPRTHPGSLMYSSSSPFISISRLRSIPPSSALVRSIVEIWIPQRVAGQGRTSENSQRRISMPRALSTVRRRSVLSAQSTSGIPTMKAGGRKRITTPTTNPIMAAKLAIWERCSTSSGPSGPLFNVVHPSRASLPVMTSASGGLSSRSVCSLVVSSEIPPSRPKFMCVRVSMPYRPDCAHKSWSATTVVPGAGGAFRGTDCSSSSGGRQGRDGAADGPDEMSEPGPRGLVRGRGGCAELSPPRGAPGMDAEAGEGSY